MQYFCGVKRIFVFFVSDWNIAEARKDMIIMNSKIESSKVRKFKGHLGTKINVQRYLIFRPWVGRVSHLGWTI